MTCIAGMITKMILLLVRYLPESLLVKRGARFIGCLDASTGLPGQFIGSLRRTIVLSIDH